MNRHWQRCGRVLWLLLSGPTLSDENWPEQLSSCKPKGAAEQNDTGRLFGGATHLKEETEEEP